MGYEKVKIYAAIADETAEQITNSYVKWTEFLTTASRLYKYPYQEQLMIYAQRPDATRTMICGTRKCAGTSGEVPRESHSLTPHAGGPG